MNGRLYNTLKGYGFSGTLNEMLYAYYGGTAKTLPQREIDWLTAKGFNQGALEDRRRAFYKTFGTGSNNDIEWNNIPLAFPPILTASSFDPANTSTLVTLSENNQRMTSSGGDRASKSILSFTTGKRYFELEIVVYTGGSFGLASAAQSNETWIGDTANSAGYDGSSGNYITNNLVGNSAGIGVAATGNVIGIYADLVNRKMWATKSGTLGSGEDPVGNTGGTSIPTGGLFATCAGNSTTSVRIRTIPSQFLTQPLAGYTAWGS